MNKLSRILVTKITTFAVIAVDLSMAYVLIDLLLGQSLTWPVILIAAWVEDTVLTPQVRKGLWGK